MSPIISSAILLGLLGQATAHSWLEQLQVISSSGDFIGDYGYPRGYVARTDPGFNGDSVDYLLPALASSRTRIDNSDLLCHPAQRTQNQTQQYPRLQASSGDYVTMKYLENGHVTLPQNQKGKPKEGGTVFIYGTTKPSDTEKIADVLEWTKDGSGGNKKGFLISAQNFDDGRCHQINGGQISQQRQQQFPDRVPGQRTSNVEQWCESNIQIPESAKTDETLALYWVWQWPTEAGADPTYPTGKDEYYTTCSDVDIVAGPIKDTKPVHTLGQQDPQTTACSDFKDRTALTTSPVVTLAGGRATASYGGSSAAATSASRKPAASSPNGVQGSSSSASFSPIPTTAPAPAQIPSLTSSYLSLTLISLSSSSSSFAPTSLTTSAADSAPTTTAAVSQPATVTITDMFMFLTQTIPTPSGFRAPPAAAAAAAAAAAVVGGNGVVGEHVRRHIENRHGAKFRF
ncbi:hypothetical protein H2203_006937 [Taxawa tesnikishii (nom. ined.)]|nr:hypothetical protein H2203_006937 [Dothideales sp. JES 119]